MKPHKIFVKARHTLPHAGYVNVGLRAAEGRMKQIVTLYNEEGDAVAAFLDPEIGMSGEEEDILLLAYIKVPLTEIYNVAVSRGAKINKSRGADLYIDEETARKIEKEYKGKIKFVEIK